MKREVLYRAKTRGSGEWVYGYYCKYGKHIHKIHSVDKDGNAVVQGDIDIVTLCEYTGLKDKNGKRIFEGDIVQWGMNGLEIPIRKAVVEILPDIQFRCLNLKDSEGKRRIFNYGNFAYRDTEKYLEVISNIYDNPKLLIYNS